MAHVTQDHIKTVEKLISELSSEDKPTYANLEVILSLSEILNRARVSRGPCHLCNHYAAEEEDGYCTNTKSWFVHKRMPWHGTCMDFEEAS